LFHVRSIFPDQGRVVSNSLALEPTNVEGEAVCSLFEKFFSARPPSFREPLCFMKKGDFEIDWSSAEGGVALASLFQAGEPLSMSVLVSGQNSCTDALMLEVFRENVLSPLFDSEYDHVTQIELRPLLIEVVFPGRPEWVPAVQLLSACLGSVYFRSVRSATCSADDLQRA
jgi:hypothetical protein